MEIQCSEKSCRNMIGLRSNYLEYLGHIFCSLACRELWRAKLRKKMKGK